LKVVFAFLLTMPGLPIIYYGDEIGMRCLKLPSKEGGYDRTGSRTPMQWTAGHKAGFSSAPAEKLYLPVDPAPRAPNVADQVRACRPLRRGCRSAFSSCNLDRKAHGG
jgi:maltose alpha-D-glucosyltransferase/alpha-amylase